MAITEGLGPQMFMGMPGVLAFPINPPSLGQSFRNPPLQFVVQAPSYAELDTAVEALMTKVRAYPGLTNVDSDLKLNKPQRRSRSIATRPRRWASGIDAIGRSLETLLGGRRCTRFKREASSTTSWSSSTTTTGGSRQTSHDLYVRGRAAI